jgi:hypothetical protein
MAMLQAARAEALGLGHDSALSFGLNRAIFFAAAKRGFKGGGRNSRGEETTSSIKDGDGKRKERAYLLGDELAYTDPNSKELLFAFGDETQTPKDFERQIKARFGSDSAFKKAWKQAEDIVQKYDKDVLKSQQEFYEQVYKPRRDSLSSEWTELTRTS